MITSVGSNIKILRGYATSQWAWFILGIVTLIGGSIASFAIPALLGVVVDAMTVNDMHKINVYCIGMMIIILFSSLCVWVRGSTFNIISERIAKYLRYDLFLHLINKDVAFFDEHKTGDILSRISSDTAVIQDGLGTNISMFIRAMIFIVISIAILALLSWKLTLVTVGGIVPIIVVLFVYGIQLKKLTRKQQDKKAELGQISEEAISNIRTVKAFANERNEHKRFI